ncbi:MAG: hypothetical protein Q7V01_13925 [Vicinamibacterales bacterium]|nr:hypothetical protein [Vicinamibacterales bacterium]
MAPDRRALLLLLLVAALSLPGVTLRIYASDEIQYFAYLRSLWFDRDVSFENEYRHFADSGVAGDGLFRETFLERRSATGLRLNFGTIGSAVLWAPFYAAADAGVALAQVFGSPVARDGYSRPYVAAVCYGSAVYGLLALGLSWAVAARVLAASGSPTRDAWPAAVAIFAGTPLVFYMYVAPVMAHATSAFAVALFVWLWLRARERWATADAVRLGAAAALMTMVREQDAFFAVVPALDFVWTALQTRRWRAWVAGAAGLLAFGLVYLPQAAAYLTLNGRIGPSQVTSRKMDWTSPHALDVLTSPQHGFFVWTPLAALALAGLAVLAWSTRRSEPDGRGARAVAAGFAAMAALQVFVTGAVQSWTLAGAFGQRRFLALTVILVAGLATVLSRPRTAPVRAGLGVAVGVCIWWNIGLMVQFGAGLMDRQRLDLPRNVYQTFVTVPRELPGIAYRYVFERHSFYRASPHGDGRDTR